MTQNKIPKEEYKKILEKMPICCVDLVITHNNKVLLIRRKNEPEKNKWWIPGGRIYKNEKLKDAAIRKAKEEVNLNVKIEKIIRVYDYFSEKNVFNDLKTGTHSVDIVFLVKPLDENIEVKIDNTSSDFKWADKIEKDLDPYIKTLLKDSQIFD